jgi:hypothetical protein
MALLILPKGWLRVVGQKQSAICGLAVEFQNFCAVGQKIKTLLGRQ